MLCSLMADDVNTKQQIQSNATAKPLTGIVNVSENTEGLESVYECVNKCPVALHQCKCMEVGGKLHFIVTLHCPCGCRLLVKS